MFKIYTASDFVYEIEKNISLFKFSLELLINEDDLISVSKTLLTALDKEIDVEIIIVSESDKQSIRIFNLISRLTDCGAVVYWNKDPKILLNESFFLIYDKVNVINKIFYSTEDSVEGQVRYLSDMFKSIRDTSDLLVLKNDDIKASFSADKTIIHRNELITIFWDVQGASYVNISPELDDVEHQGSAKVKIKKDTLIQLIAKNKNHTITKNIFIKVLIDSMFEINIDVFDPFLNEYISLTPIIENDIEKYMAFSDQKIRISWDFASKKSFKEYKLGSLDLKGEYVFTLKKKKSFKFYLNTINEKLIKKVELYGVKDDKISKMVKNNTLSDKKKNQKKSWLSKILNFFKSN